MTILLLMSLVISAVCGAMEMELPSMSTYWEEDYESAPLQRKDLEGIAAELANRISTTTQNYDDFKTCYKQELFKSANRQRLEYHVKKCIQQEIDKRRELERTFFITDDRKWHELQKTLQGVERIIVPHLSDSLFEFNSQDGSPVLNEQIIAELKQDVNKKILAISRLHKEIVYLDYYCRLERKQAFKNDYCLNLVGQIGGYSNSIASLCAYKYGISSAVLASTVSSACLAGMAITSALGCCMAGGYFSVRCCCPGMLTQENSTCLPSCLQISTLEGTHMQLVKSYTTQLLETLKNP